MQSRIVAFIERLQQVTTFEGFQSLIEELQGLYQVEHFVYHSINSAGEPYAALTYSLDWVDHYLDRDFGRIDPVVLGCYQRFHPVDWKQLDWSGKAVKSFLLEATDAGVGNQGFSIPIRGPNGQFALFTVNHRCSDQEWATFTNAHVQDLLLIAHYLNQKALEIERGTDKLPDQPLSPRELDVLTLIGMGKSRGHAADSLSISEHTLRVYIESARFKLGAANTTHAVALAMARGKIIV
ncbi:MAG: LuxR family transcriptional regulator [Alphaproteobacteria bacterium]|nr:LuxR family transcriptional regulator [Alphaproteobacteria bacterium]